MWGFAATPQPEMRHRGVYLLGELALDFARIERLQHCPELGVVGELEIQPGIESSHQMQRLGDFLFNAQVHLQGQLLAKLADARLPALRHQYENRQEDRL